MVRIRMSRHGRTNRPFFRINAIAKRTQRDGKVIENLGWYDPIAGKDKQLVLKADRIKHWLSVGAQPSDTVRDMLIREGLVDGAEAQAQRTSRIAAKAASAAKKAAAAPPEGEKKKA